MKINILLVACLYYVSSCAMKKTYFSYARARHKNPQKNIASKKVPEYYSSDSDSCSYEDFEKKFIPNLYSEAWDALKKCRCTIL